MGATLLINFSFESVDRQNSFGTDQTTNAGARLRAHR